MELLGEHEVTLLRPANEVLLDTVHGFVVHLAVSSCDSGETASSHPDRLVLACPEWLVLLRKIAFRAYSLQVLPDGRKLGSRYGGRLLT